MKRLQCRGRPGEGHEPRVFLDALQQCLHQGENGEEIRKGKRPCTAKLRQRKHISPDQKGCDMDQIFAIKRTTLHISLTFHPSQILNHLI